jgi:hypothetical protein
LFFYLYHPQKAKQSVRFYQNYALDAIKPIVLHHHRPSLGVALDEGIFRSASLAKYATAF